MGLSFHGPQGEKVSKYTACAGHRNRPFTNAGHTWIKIQLVLQGSSEIRLYPSQPIKRLW